MDANANLDNIMKRPTLYWYEDGLGELITGMIFLVVGGFILTQGLITHPLLQAIAGILGMIVIGGAPFIGRYLIRRLKERMIYPRTGYVKYSTATSSRRVFSMVIAALATGGLVLLVSVYSEILHWLPLIEGVAVGGLLLYQATQIGLPRLYIEVVASLLLGAGLSVAGIGNTIGSGAYFLGFGLVLAFLGGIALTRYLSRTTPVLGEE
jgi:hypothetical protein